MRAFHVSSGTNHTIYAPFSFTTAKHTTQEQGLLDSRATHNFIDMQTVQRLGIGTRKLDTPREVTNMDGTKNQGGNIYRYTNLELSYQGKTETLEYYITNLGKDRIIFGLPWFQAFEPNISWKEGRLDGTVTARTRSAVKMGINATQATQWAIKEQANKTKLMEDDLPEHYQDYKDVFSEEKAKRFPPEREDDHEINFTPDTPKSFSATTYKMKPKALEFLRKWQDEELAKGFIRYSKSPYTCPTFLIS